jgi:anti-sigma factor RsiW
MRDPMSDGDFPHVTCQEFVELVTAYLDGALPADQVVSIDAHLEVCPGCVTVIEQWRSVISLAGELREDDVDELPADVRANLIATFRAARGT